MFMNITRTEIVMIALPALVLLVVLEMVRRERLREDYSLLWLGAFGLLVAVAVFRRSLLDAIAGWMGISYPPSALFVLGFGGLMLIMLQFSAVISRLARQNKQAAQHIALLSMRVQSLEEQLTRQQG